MFDTWFTNKCMALVDGAGRALTGPALDNAEKALELARKSNCKLWTDRNGYFYRKERRLFSKAEPVRDESGNVVRICGHLVKTKAKFCSKCGNPAPGGWWVCSNCGKQIGNESHTCPHCGQKQNVEIRMDMKNGVWQKDEDIFAERFELAEASVFMPNGLNVQENHAAILLEGGAAVEVLQAGFFALGDLTGPNGAQRSLIMVDNSEFNLPLFVDSVRTKDNLLSDLHAVLVLRFAPENAGNFIKNLMGSSLYLRNGKLTSAIGYDEIAHNILQTADASIREFCSQYSISDLFKSAAIRIQLEDSIAVQLRTGLDSVSLQFIRLKEMDFESEIFNKLREMSGQLEAKRREIEYMQRADELANDATRREAMSEHEMEDYMNQLAHEKEIKDELRIQELERMKTVWARQAEKEALSYEHDLDDLQQDRQLARDMRDEEFKENEKDLHHKRELERRIREQNTSLEYVELEDQIQNIRLAMEKRKVEADQESTEKWLKIKQQKQTFNQAQKIEMIKASAGADLRALLMAEDDPDKRESLLRLMEQESQAKMTPELLLAAAAARGNASAAEALSRIKKDQSGASETMLEALERMKKEDRSFYESILQMNERMFKQATESLSKNQGGSSNTTQIIK